MLAKTKNYRKNWTKADKMLAAIATARRKCIYYIRENDLRAVYVNRMITEGRKTGQPDFFKILLSARKMGSNPGSANY